jgi:hypothetical protein
LAQGSSGWTVMLPGVDSVHGEVLFEEAR